MSTERRPLHVTGEAATPGDPLDGIADDLVEAYFDPEAAEMQHIGSYELPSEAGVEHAVELCRELLFPGYAGPDVPRSDRRVVRALVRGRLDELRIALHEQVYRANHHKRQQLLGLKELECVECRAKATVTTESLIARLPELRRQVRLDLRAAFESDPAASGIDEILFCYPGTYAITVYRIAHALLAAGSVMVPRMMTELAHRRTGIDIHPGAQIGEAFFIDHGTGVVIGETTLIGNRVRIYQGVTLGALTIPQGEERPAAGERRHPTIEDDAVIYANATILGGNTVIGQGAVIGGNTFITASVAAGKRISGRARSITVTK